MADEPQNDPALETPATDDLGDAGKKALDAERARAKEADKRAKALEKQIEELKAASLSESEKAVAEAYSKGKAEGTTAGAVRLARAELTAAAATAGVDLSADLEVIDLNRFVTEDGEPDADMIGKYVTAKAASAAPATPAIPSFDGGVRTTAPKSQGPAQDFAAALGKSLAR